MQWPLGVAKHNRKGMAAKTHDPLRFDVWIDLVWFTAFGHMQPHAVA